MCEDRSGLAGMIWHLAVHPDHRAAPESPPPSSRKRSGSPPNAVSFASRRGRETTSTSSGGTSRHGFERIDSYLQVYVELEDGLRDLFPIADGIRPVRLFAHYLGDDRDAVRRRFARVHDCVLYERRFGAS